MNAWLHDRRTMVAAGIVAITAVVAVFVVIPLASIWSDLGAQLNPKLARVAQLRAQVDGYNALVTRRDALAKRMGSVLGRPASSADKKGSETPGKPKEGKPKESAAKDASEKSDKKDAKTDPVKTDPVKPDSTKSDSAKADAAKSGASKSEAARTDVAKADSAASPDGKVGATKASMGPAATPGETPSSPKAVPSPEKLASAPAEKLAQSSPVGGNDTVKAKDNPDKRTASDTAPTVSSKSPTPGGTEAKTESKDKREESAPSVKGSETLSTPATSGKAPKPEDAKGAAAKGAPAGAGSEGSSSGSGTGDERLAAYFERSASQAGVKIKRVSSKKGGGGPRPGKYYTPVTLQLTVEGKAESLVKLLYTIEKGDRFARVEQMDLHRDVAKGNLIEANLDVLGYER